MDRKRRPDEAQHRPLTPVLFTLLTILAREPQHGYALLTGIQTDMRLDISQATIYRAIRHAQRLGLVAETPTRPAAPDDDARRRYWALTRHGRAVLHAEATRLYLLGHRALQNLSFSARA